jgi:hypothetical protein
MQCNVTRYNRIFLPCPSEAATRPSTIILFELFRVRDGTSQFVDEVAGWGAFPLVNAQKALVRGRFR